MIRVLTGLWGFGTTFPSAKVHISSLNSQDALRVQVNGSTRLRVHGNDGVSLGSLTASSANDVFVSNSLGIRIAAPGVKLHVIGGSNASLSTGGFIVSEPVLRLNLAFDNNEIMARLNGVASDLFLNHNGGIIIMNAGPNSAAGRLGLHTTSPQVEAHLVHGTGNGSDHGFRLANTGSNNEDWTMYVQNSNGSLQLYANNVLKGNFNDNSGVWMKKDIETPEAVLAKVMQLRVKKYHFLTSVPEDKKNYGLMAQEVEKIFPEVVFKQKQDDGTEVYTMDYSAFGVLAIKAIQEMQQNTKEQQLKVDALLKQQVQVETLLDRIDKFESVASGNTSVDLGDLDLIGVSLEQNQPNPIIPRLSGILYPQRQKPRL